MQVENLSYEMKIYFTSRKFSLRVAFFFLDKIALTQPFHTVYEVLLSGNLIQKCGGNS